MDATITFPLNGKSQTVSTDPERALLNVLREGLHLTGTKYGCGEGECRACTVLLNDEPRPSCLTPISSVDKQTVITSNGRNTRVSRAVILQSGSPAARKRAPTWPRVWR
jgi:aerobic-type carbon monoxide dehydrogenase small subunit (CoxS/CutS family)